ncbi:hypothetical protein [Roseococcus suduntuyensis]|uniref:Uncharacterized protein n=1 Tax=Roseococcus suduntuyensis TaxID=455361 RepID=A0A840AEB5_9PROT|nr:hypothetical protein [Roseococcus suduntuyensis]MBB3899969.1 hypothetical protein [Roseococcus suduntuyensis]
MREPRSLPPGVAEYLADFNAITRGRPLAELDQFEFSKLADRVRQGTSETGLPAPLAFRKEQIRRITGVLPKRA